MTAKNKGRGGDDVVLPADDSAGHLTRVAFRTFQRCLQKEIAPHGVRNSQWSFLRVLWEKDGLTQRELADAVQMLEPATASIIKALETDGLIRRERSQTDRRKFHIYLTEKGRSLKQTVLPLAARVNEAALAGLTDEELAVFKRVLTTMMQNLGDAYGLSGTYEPKSNEE